MRERDGDLEPPVEIDPHPIGRREGERIEPGNATMLENPLPQRTCHQMSVSKSIAQPSRKAIDASKTTIRLSARIRSPP